MKYPCRLTVDEWNLLQDLTTYNHMDCWFDLRNGKKYDYVHDIENGGRIGLREAIEEIAEGMWSEDLKKFKDGVKTWNGLMDRFNIRNYKVNS